MVKRLVIIGGDAAGMSAATQARRMKTVAELEIVAFERSSRTSYAACGLPYLVGGFVKSPNSLIARSPEQHRAKGIDVRTRHEVRAIDVSASTVTVRDLESGQEFSADYDDLLMSTGASGILPKWPGIDAKGVLQLRTLDDAAAVEQLLAGGAQRAVVVGAGYIGLEVAEGLLQRGLQVTVVERLDAPMGAVLDADMAVDVADAMRAAGVDLRLGTTVTGFTVDGGRVRAVQTAAGPVEADLVVIGLGVRPNAELARAAGVGVLGTAITRFNDMEIARTGLTEREAMVAGLDAIGVITEASSRAHYYPGAEPMKIKMVVERGSGRLLGAQIVGGTGAGKRIDVLATALWNGMTVAEVAGMDLSYAPPFSPVWDPVLLAAGKTASEV